MSESSYAVYNTAIIVIENTQFMAVSSYKNFKYEIFVYLSFLDSASIFSNSMRATIDVHLFMLRNYFLNMQAKVVSTCVQNFKDIMFL